MWLISRNYLKVSPNAVAVLSGRQAQAARRTRRRLPHGPRRRGAADPAARESRIPAPERDDDPARDQAGLHVEGRSRFGEGRREREDPRRRDVAAGGGGTVPRNDARSDAEGHLPDARGAPAIDSRHADSRGGQQRPPELRAEADQRSGSRIWRRWASASTCSRFRRSATKRSTSNALGKRRTAEVKRDATIGEAEAHRDAKIKSAAGAAGRGAGQVQGGRRDLAGVSATS